MSIWQDAGQELEDFVETVYSGLLKNEHLKNAKIEKSHIEIGRSGAKQSSPTTKELTLINYYSGM